MLIRIARFATRQLDRLRGLDFLASLALRAYLVPVFYMASTAKWNPFDPASSLDSTIAWFANPDWGLGLPYPAVNAYLAWGAEYFGWICLLLGFALRWIAIPLMVTMVVAATSVHLENGWLAIADDTGWFATERTTAAIERLDRAKGILKQHGDYDYLTEHGGFVVLNNGIEFATTYFVMLLALFFLGAGRYVSVDYWLRRRFMADASTAG